MSDTSELRRARAASFAVGAARYAAIRPAYPDAAVAWLVPDEAASVLDLGAGTGKLTAALVRPHRTVVAVEPAEGMRAELSAALPAVRALPGSAEAIPLADAAVDAVAVAQAWHWFDPAAASAEIARVLRPGGSLGLVWNDRDDGVAWVARLTALLRTGDALGGSYTGETPELGPEFLDLEPATFRWTQHLPPGGLRDLAATRSHLLTLPAPEREAILDGVAALEREVVESGDCDEVGVRLPYVTRCWRARRR